MEKKVWLASIGVLLVFVVVVTAVLPFLTPSKETETQKSLKETDRNFYYGCLYGQLMSSFPMVSIQTEYGEKEVISYPPEYGGAYVDKSDTLHIVLTKKANMTTKQDYLEIMDNDEDIIFESGDFALSHLYEIQRTLTVVMQEFSIEATGINETANRLELYMLDSAKENEVSEFLKNKFNNFNVRCLSFNGALGIRPSAVDVEKTLGMLPPNLMFSSLKKGLTPTEQFLFPS